MSDIKNFMDGYRQSLIQLTKPIGDLFENPFPATLLGEDSQPLATGQATLYPLNTDPPWMLGGMFEPDNAGHFDLADLGRRASALQTDVGIRLELDGAAPQGDLTPYILVFVYERLTLPPNA